MLRYVADYPEPPKPLKVGDHTLEWRQLNLAGELVWVPNHISRIDVDNNHCWTVRIVRVDEPRFSVSFNDTVYGNTKAAYHAALRALKDALPHYRPRDRLCPGHANTIRIYRYYRRNRGVAEYRASVHLCWYQRKRRTYTVSLGTENTISYVRAIHRLRFAVALRLWANDVVKAAGRKALFDMGRPDDRYLLRQYRQDVDDVKLLNKRDYNRLVVGEVVATHIGQ